MNLKIAPWHIEASDCSLETEDFRESIFSQANGYMGMRGFAPEGIKRNTHSRSTFIAGFFEYIRPGITDMVNQPDPSATKLLLNGIDAAALAKTDSNQTLDMRDGALRWNYTVKDMSGRSTRISVTRFLSMKNRHIAAFRFELTPDHDGIYSIRTGIDSDVENLPVADNQCLENTELARFWGEADTNENGLYVETSYSKRGTAMEYRTSGALCGSFRQGETVTVDKIAAIYCFRDGDDIKSQARHGADDAIETGFDDLLAMNRETWDRIWENADIGLDADNEIQGAARYNIFQLIQAAPCNDMYASIGARGLTHGRYKGCTFWDTEIFMLPFYLHTDPETAKNLLLYRYNSLSDSIESAKRFSLTGARYSWMASDTGFEQCETWDTGCCEIHVTADVAYAFWRYVEVTGDDDFFTRYAVEVYIQTARYWASRFTYDAASDKYNLLFVKGPDEYCGVANNNFYTVRLAAHNLQLAVDSVKRMEADFPGKWQAIRRETGYEDSEMAKWSEIIGKTAVRYDDKRQLYIQDDTFELLEPIDLANSKNDDIPMYHKLNYDRLQRYQMLKQADVLMLMALLPDSFTYAQKQAAWEYYEPKTLHDSTLSYGAHALIAARIGAADKADGYFNKSCFLDLRDIMKNTAREGLHVASFGITWQGLVFGYAGLWADGNGLRCDPKLPEWIRGMSFRVFYKSKPYAITITHDEVKITESTGP